MLRCRSIGNRRIGDFLGSRRSPEDSLLLNCLTDRLREDIIAISGAYADGYAVCRDVDLAPSRAADFASAMRPALAAP